MAARNSSSSVTHARILLVDDNANGLAARRSVLEELGHRIVTATSGSDALEQFSAHRFDLVVTDYKMPRMDQSEFKFPDEIEDTKNELIATTDGIPSGQPVPELRMMEKKDDYDAPTNIMCGDDQNGKGKKASELKDKIEAFKKVILANCPKGMEGESA